MLELSRIQQPYDHIHHSRDAWGADDQAVGAREVLAAQGFSSAVPPVHQPAGLVDGQDRCAPPRSVRQEDFGIGVADLAEVLVWTWEEPDLEVVGADPIEGAVPSFLGVGPARIIGRVIGSGVVVGCLRVQVQRDVEAEVSGLS
ncbi:hypothetical protein ACIODT_40235 [Streptomyces sp. NPDC088251]|uniref:hypothetical protein n=1 Tax=unclassified Streptomyces TaxID=2593676 RepID=UPI00381D530C